MSLLRKSIEKKADSSELKPKFENIHNLIEVIKNKMLESNEELENLQKANKKTSKKINELQEVNKDVLLGKKTLKCLSCFNSSDDF
jgi:chromosome segregation ATPase